MSSSLNRFRLLHLLLLAFLSGPSCTPQGDNTSSDTGTLRDLGTISVSSGDSQTGVAGSALSSPLVAEVRDIDNNVVSGVTVSWNVTAGGGSVSSCTTTTTDASGLAECTLTLGTTVGANTVTASVSGLDTPATFSATGTAGAAASISVSSGSSQTGATSAALINPLIAVVRDTNNNVVSGVTVSWSVTAGGGSVSSCTTTTNASGLAQCTLTLGSTAGANTVTASVSGIGTPATFSATGITPATVTSVAAPSDGSYYVGQNLDFSLSMSKAVTVSGAPRLALTLGSATRYADYHSQTTAGDGSSILLFRYTVEASLTVADSDGIAMTSPIDLNGGNIADSSSIVATLTYTAPTTNSVLVPVCPTNYVPFNALSPYTTSAFCVAKYEMKCTGSSCSSTNAVAVAPGVNAVATSQPSGLAWWRISRANSIVACTNLGAGYDLISNAQWQTAARDLESVGWNWSGGTVGSAGGMSKGNSCLNGSTPSIAGHASHGNGKAASTDDNPCFGINLSAGGDVDSSTCSESVWFIERRTLKTSGGDYIWDLPGNQNEYMKDDSSSSFDQAGGTSTAFIPAITDSTHTVALVLGGLSGNAKFHFGPAGDYSSATSSPYAGLGRASFAQPATASTWGIARGGSENGYDNIGLFAVAQNVSTTSSSLTKLGFRCVYTPQ